MAKAIDNFGVAFDKVLKFDNPGDFYFVTVLRRRKDHEGPMASGVNEGNRLIKWYEVAEPGYLEAKRQDIINLCEANGARAYLNPQRRSRRDVLWYLHDNISEMLRQGNAEVKLDALVRRCVAGCHVSDRKRWVIDVDNPELVDGSRAFNDEGMNNLTEFLHTQIRLIHCHTDKNLSFEWLEVETPNGRHIVTEPFDLSKYSMNVLPLIEEKFPLYNDLTNPNGIEVKKDALMLLYAPESLAEESHEGQA